MRVFKLEYQALGQWFVREWWDSRKEAEDRLRFYARRDQRPHRVREEKDKYKTRFLKPVKVTP